MHPITIDFETRARVDIKVGPHRYAEDTDTDVMCLAWSEKPRGDVYLWQPGYPSVGIEPGVYYRDPTSLEVYPIGEQDGQRQISSLHRQIEKGRLIEAHNAMFEQCVWLEQMVKKFSWPSIPLRQWRCSAAMAASFSLPRKLEKAVEALRLPVKKDMAGNRLMLKLAKPRIPLKADREVVAAAMGLSTWKDVPKAAGTNMFDLLRWIPEDIRLDLIMDGHLNPWNESEEDLTRLFKYCMQDVTTEQALSEQLRPLSELEQEVWFLDQEMNHEGIYCDLPLVEKALELSDHILDSANERVVEITAGEVRTVNQRAKLLEWINARQDSSLPDMKKDTLEVAMDHEDRFAPEAFELILLRLATAKSSTKKYKTMLASCCKDGRIRDLLAYWGADTGRWAGRGVQPQNFPRGNAKNRMKITQDEETGEYEVKKWFDMNVGCDDVMAFDADELEATYGDPMEALSTCLRGAMTAAPGKDLVVADYSSIEARGVFWISDDFQALEVFNQGKDIYLDQCTAIYDRPYESFSKDDAERQVGKQAVLGLGYQMGGPKFQDTCAGYKIHLDLKFCEMVKNAYRELHAPVKEFWGNIEAAAIEAVRRGEDVAPVDFVHGMKFAVRGRFLYMKLPSGRLLAYYNPGVEMRRSTVQVVKTYTNDLGEETTVLEEIEIEKESLRYWGMDSQTRQWRRQHTYGGKLTENCVQALSRDIMAEAMLRAKATGLYRPILTVHDEIVAEVPKGQGSVEEFEGIMSVLPEWAIGFPLAAEGWRGVRYRK